MSKNKIMIIAAHPDDEVLGCGGTISRLIDEGYEAYTLILGKGIGARFPKDGDNAKKNKYINIFSKSLK